MGAVQECGTRGCGACQGGPSTAAGGGSCHGQVRSCTQVVVQAISEGVGLGKSALGGARQGGKGVAGRGGGHYDVLAHGVYWGGGGDEHQGVGVRNIHRGREGDNGGQGHAGIHGAGRVALEGGGRYGR